MNACAFWREGKTLPIQLQTNYVCAAALLRGSSNVKWRAICGAVEVVFGIVMLTAWALVSLIGLVGR